ncbi:myo-inositol-1(or 4)-monophosphatase [Rhizobium sp. RU35A]|uniref:inositol monophosphatase family protein n=1 Tax=Rhizobium sp. RU35A TaxID=1907414 RepID=UPI000955EB33|nr:inositol monophosphatase family protein [Rhizobium sp. RU35A]SIQ01175.1 myo-inositol-1(or 4)-monophosphatase [Rhizobium sp. RU35A]
MTDSLPHANPFEARARVAIDIARQVGRWAARHRAENDPLSLSVENKGPQDFVTAVDRRAEAEIRASLVGAFAGDGFLGEEGGTEAGSGGMWVVDPIDGTTNYIRGFRHWGVSIAYVEADAIRLGVIYDATQDCVFHAIAGAGAFKEGAPIRAAATRDPTAAMAMIGHSRRTSFEDYLAISRRLHDLGVDYRRMGAAAIGLVRVAEGVADLYYERHLNSWDMLAGALIAREAGAHVAMAPVPSLLAQGGGIVACAPGLTDCFSFLT